MGSIRSQTHINKSFSWGCIPTLNPNFKTTLGLISNTKTTIKPNSLEKDSVAEFSEYGKITQQVHRDFFNEMNERAVEIPIW